MPAALSPIKVITAGRIAMVLLGCLALLVVCFVVSVALGEQPLLWSELNVPGSTTNTIFYELRLPRVLLAALVGAALSTAGATLQSLMRNPLADPFVLGVSGGAALGATLAVSLGITTVIAGLAATTLLSLGGALGAMVLVLAIGRLGGSTRSDTTLLAGVTFNSFALAAILFIKALVAPDRLGEILFWLAGSLRHEDLTTLAVAGTLISLSLGGMIAMSGRLNLLLLGDDDARSLGVDVGRSRLILLVLASLAVALAVSLAGLVGFVGLLVPHLAKLAFGADQRVSLPASALLGASFLMLADLLTRVLFRVLNTEPIVGVVTALLGVPFFLVLLARQRV